MKIFLRRNRKVIVLAGALTLFLLSTAGIQMILNQMEPFEDVPVVSVDEKEEETNQETQETFIQPVSDDVQVVRTYYDTSLSDEELENALIEFEGVYRPNYGLDYGLDGQAFDVKACASGTVTKKENDALLGWQVTIEHQNGILTTYQSLDNIKVEKGQEVKQGDVIATSGENVYESDLKSHLHLILTIDDTTVNPASYYGQEIVKMKL